MNRGGFKELLTWSSLFAATISFCVIAFVKWRSVFESGTIAGLLVLISLVAGLISIILALFSVPRIPSLVALMLCGVVVYIMLFTRLYGLS